MTINVKKFNLRTNKTAYPTVPAVIVRMTLNPNREKSRAWYLAHLAYFSASDIRENMQDFHIFITETS